MGPASPVLIPPTPLDERANFHDFGLGFDHEPDNAQRGSGPRLSLTPEIHSPQLIDIPTMDDTRLSPSLSAFGFQPHSHAPDKPGGSTSNRSSLDGQGEPSPSPSPSPFNYTPQHYTTGKPPLASRELGKRKGHKYKHSSVSHQIFLEPPQRLPLALPAALPTPTRAELQNSLTSEQKLRLAWCATHLLVAAYVQWSAQTSLAMTALSRLLLFDATGAVICVAVDIMANFEVWKRSSLKHPFGLERVDVLAGFGLAVFVAFMGLDVLSHGIEHSLQDAGHHDRHVRISPGEVDLTSLLAILTTLVSALLLRNHVRISRAMRLGRIVGWTKVLSNPSHFMTLSCSVLLLLLPLLSIETYAWVDPAISLFVAIIMVAFGVRLGTSLAPMLLMSYAGPDGATGRASVRDVIAEIGTDPAITGIDEARFWQVHYGLCIASLRLRYRGSGYSDDMFRLREKLTSLVRNRLGGAYGSGGLKWEISIQLSLETDLYQDR